MRAKGKKCPLLSDSLEGYQREGNTGQEAGGSRAGLFALARNALTPCQSPGPTQASTQPAHPATGPPAPHPPPGAVPLLQSLPEPGCWASAEPESDGRRDPEGRARRGAALERARAERAPPTPGSLKAGKTSSRPLRSPALTNLINQQRQLVPPPLTSDWMLWKWRFVSPLEEELPERRGVSQS